MEGADKIFAVIDTNVLVSSFFSKEGTSNPSIIIESIFQNKIVPIFNNDIINEYREVLYRSKFQFPAFLIEKIIDTLIKLGIKIEKGIPTEEFSPILRI